MDVFLRLILSVQLLASFSAVADAIISPALQANRNDIVDIMVYLESSVELNQALLIPNKEAKGAFIYDILTSEARMSQAGILKELSVMGLDSQSFYIENAIAVKGVNKKAIARISKMANVARVALDAKIEMNLPPEQQYDETQRITQPLQMIDAERVWNELGVRGEGIVVAGQDTGVRWDHESIINQYRGVENGQLKSHDYSWHDAIHSSSGSCGSDSPTPCDDHSHGTHTVGSMVGDNKSDLITGVAPEAKWIACRNMDKGVGTVSTYLECFQFFLAPYPVGGNPMEDGDPSKAPHVTNNSWSCPPSEGCDGEEFLDAIRALNAAGIVTVVSAGNDGPGCESVAKPPGMYAGEIISVGAYNRYRREIAFFSSRGPSAWNGELAPSVTAPGSNIKAATNSSRSSYGEKSGTSMAGPHVAGVVALLWSAKPELIGQVEQTMKIIAESSTPINQGASCSGFPGGRTPNAVYGWGMVNAWQAIQF